MSGLRDQTVYVGLGIGDVQLVFADVFDGGKALLRVLQTQEGTGVALGQAVVVQSLRHRLLQPQQTQLVGHGGLAAAQLSAACCWLRP